MRRLIVNADDFGLTSGVNRGILQSHEEGIVTSTTVMACGARFDEAVSLAPQSPRLSVGCHVVLVDGTPLSEPKQVSSLAPTNGRFRDSLANFACAAAAGRLDERQIEAEIMAQIRKLQSSGVEVSHLDSHKHTHMFPAVLKGMLRAAKNCGVHAIRNPFEPLVFARVGTWKRQFQLTLMHSFRNNFRRGLEMAGVKSPDGCIGIAATGGLSAETFLQLIQELPEGTWEFVSHPGYNDGELDQVKTRLRQSREKELEILTSESTKQAIHNAGIQLISYREL